MKRRLRLYDPAATPLDESFVLPCGARTAVPTATLAVIADGGEDVSPLVEAALEHLGDRGHYLEAGASATDGKDGSEPEGSADLDERLASAYRGAEGRLVVAVGPEVPARLSPTVLVVVTGGRSLARLAPATRLLLPDAHLILNEGRAGVGRGLAAMLSAPGGPDGV